MEIHKLAPRFYQLIKPPPVPFHRDMREHLFKIGGILLAIARIMQHSIYIVENIILGYIFSQFCLINTKNLVSDIIYSSIFANHLSGLPCCNTRMIIFQEGKPPGRYIQSLPSPARKELSGIEKMEIRYAPSGNN